MQFKSYIYVGTGSDVIVEMTSHIPMDWKQVGGAHRVVRTDVDVSAADDGMTGSIMRSRY
jgi:hypothetical protein